MLNEVELSKLHTNQRLLIQEMQSRGICVEIIYKDIELIKATYKNHVEWILDRESSINSTTIGIIASNKYLTKKILEKEKINTPKGEMFFVEEWQLAILYARKIGFPVVVKPVRGSHGDNIYMDIENEMELKNIIKNIFVKKMRIPFLVEKQFGGDEYRVFLTKEGKYAVLYREPAHVIGDGVHTIRELVEIENKKRSKRTNSLCPIAIDEITNWYMKKKKISLNNIPRKSEKNYIRHNSNVAKGGLCIDYTDNIHPSVIENCKRILKVFGNISYLGIDYMSKDITTYQTEDIYSIIEINTVPGLHMHMRPSAGKSRNVAKYLVDLIFPETKEEENEEF